MVNSGNYLVRKGESGERTHLGAHSGQGSNCVVSYVLLTLLLILGVS